MEKIKSVSEAYHEDFYYVGYNFEGKKMFQVLRDSVNVEFDTEVKND